MDVNKRIEELRIVPVVVLHDADDALPLAKALIQGGLPLAEITFRTEAAEESIRRISNQFPQMLVGAGTVSSVEQAVRAVDAGAKFLVSAGFQEDITEFAMKKEMPIFPGVCTPTELMMLVKHGLKVAKFFPAEQYGGIRTIQALSGPFPQMRFMPTGGINAENIKEYLEDSRIIACGGSWMVKESLIREKKYDEIRRLTEEAVSLVKH